MIVRNILNDDADAISELDVVAFTKYFPGVQSRSTQNIMASIALNPSGCFLVEDKNKIVGYIFSRLWGQTGWIGTFGIHPEYQGKGVGKTLFDKALIKLKENNCLRIGLETSEHASYNMGMYLKLGFHFIEPTLMLRKEIQEANLAPQQFSNLNDKSFNTISHLSNKAIANLDLTSEVKNAVEYGWGETIFFGDDDPFGFAVFRTQPVRGSKQNNLFISCGAIPDVNSEKIKVMVNCIETFALTKSLNSIMIPIHSSHHQAVTLLLKNGFKVQRAVVRLIHTGNYNNSSGVIFGRWAM